MAVLLTGATGFVGMEVLTRWLERGNSRVYALVRADDGEKAAERLRPGLESAFGEAGGDHENLEAVAGDVQQPQLGLDDKTYARLRRDVNVVVHSAASVSFSLGLEESRAINVEGTRNVLDFALGCPGIDRFTYVSTAYVAGTHPGTFREDQLEEGQEFRNAYERSKFEAERLVRSHRRRLPVQVLRPSIVVGERHSGWTSSFNVLYGPLKAFARGAVPAVPANADSPVDVVPVDYVADATYELSSHGPTGTYHLVAGRHATTVGRLIELASTHFQKKPPPTFPPQVYKRVVYPLVLRSAGERARKGLEQLAVFFPYFSMKVQYDDSRAREQLEPAGIRVSPVDGYFHRLLDYAQESHWGKKPRGRAEARGLPSSR
ncbi:MAG TPA: SDR family oxidoreductase [Thermoleophilaceae bacterium]|nr:SDR family oxidoreductase [Thermoleophilaceae bacterium]